MTNVFGADFFFNVAPQTTLRTRVTSSLTFISDEGATLSLTGIVFPISEGQERVIKT
jgi:hypothetical protein